MSAAHIVYRHFTLGQLRSDSPSRVEAYADRLEYFFKVYINMLINTLRS